MRKIASVIAAVVAFVCLVASQPAQAGTFYIPPLTPYAPVTGTLTFQTLYGPATCTVVSGWSFQNGQPKLGSPVLTGPMCSQIAIPANTTFMFPLPSPPPMGPNTYLNLFWRETGALLCSSGYAGNFNSTTHVLTLAPGSGSCSVQGSLTFPGLILLP